MDNATALALLQKIRTKAAQASDGEQPDIGAAFADTVKNVEAQRLRTEALQDVKNLGMLSLGVGAAGAGAYGIYNLLRRRIKPKTTRSGPSVLPLPYPIQKVAATFPASTKGGIPWYGSAMLAAGLGGLGLGWKGIDTVMAQQRKQEMEDEVERSKEEFQKALLAQYKKPLSPDFGKAAESQTSTVKAGETLDRVFDLTFKSGSVDWQNALGTGLNGYGMYAGLSGLLAGSYIYDKTSKRSRRAVLEKALKQRQMRRFENAPTEIYAVPQPVSLSEKTSPTSAAMLPVSDGA